ncbi:hypothetical protein BO85DRAFT_39366 [Aspergillus piperis CBS 112811]|uniref:Uncharacterized protein n=1 Tax=Aspergillus piperis CBS 112811 TaxID=1448313 RepID=A0A8G1QZN2_9EURO|nr:hypothetical protein BO85DRAFT_39366 [Aspergillus piperis CBS 112811]RAH56679.1 hypothetical protein BO85DRAFT_39366 [Aspergillus piperis CBS 112811]
MVETSTYSYELVPLSQSRQQSCWAVMHALPMDSPGVVILPRLVCRALRCSPARTSRELLVELRASSNSDLYRSISFFFFFFLTTLYP